MRLFWKFFLLITLSMLAVAVISSWLAQRWIEESVGMEKHFSQMAAPAEAVVAFYTQGDTAAARQWLRRSNHRMHIHAILLDHNGHQLLGRRPLPPELDHRVATAIAQQQSLRLVQPPHLLLLQPVELDGVTFYWAAMMRIPMDTMQQSLWYAQLLRLMVALLAILLLALLLSRMLIQPIRLLQQSAAQLGGGQLHHRTPEVVSRRGDELGELARDFDQMATQLESLLASHKQLLRDLSHELRSPLSRLVVALELARNTAGEAAQDELDRIALEGERLNQLIGEVLTLARFDEGAIQPALQTLDLSALLQAMVEDARFEAEAAGRSVALQLQSDVMLMGDRTWLGRALDNVLRNAVRHTDPATTIEVDLQVDAAWLEIHIRDHGAGVPEASLNELFKPFVRLDQSRSRDSGGHGVGLAIAHRVVEMHGGHISARNAEGGGLLVTLKLPKVG